MIKLKFKLNLFKWQTMTFSKYFSCIFMLIFLPPQSYFLWWQATYLTTLELFSLHFHDDFFAAPVILIMVTGNLSDYFRIFFLIFMMIILPPQSYFSWWQAICIYFRLLSLVFLCKSIIDFRVCQLSPFMVTCKFRWSHM